VFDKNYRKQALYVVKFFSNEEWIKRLKTLKLTDQREEVSHVQTHAPELLRRLL